MDRIEPPPTGRGEETGDNRGNKEHSATGEQKNRVRFRKTEGSAQPAAGTGKDLADPEFLRLMEEHNRKIRRKQSQSGGGSSSISEQSNNDRKVSEGSPLLVSLRSNSSASVGGSQKEHRGGGFKSQRRPLSEQQPKALSSEPIDCDDDLSLTELLKSENDRVLEARRKRAADRQKEIQANKTNVLRNFEGDLAARRERQLKRTSAKVEFTLAKNMSKPRVQTMKTTTGRSENVKPSTEKETKVVPGVPRLRPVPVSRQGHLASQRPRGLQGLKSRSKSTMSNAASVSSSGVSSPKNRLAHLGLKSRALSSTTPDILKDTARQKRAGKRMEIDLQSLLSKHNSQVAGNKRGLVMVKP